MKIVAYGCVCLLWLAGALPLRCQNGYFGQNKVQHKTLHFKVLTTPHFHIYYYDREQKAIPYVARMAERWYARESRLFKHEMSEPQPLIVYADQPDFAQTTVVPGFIQTGVGGVTLPLERQIVIPLAGPLAETSHVIGHELTHAFQFDMTRSALHNGVPGATRLPLWFLEGMAEYVSLGPHDPETAMWLRDAVRRDQMPTLKQLENPKYFPYRYGQAFWAFVGGQYGDANVGRMLIAGGASGSGRQALERVLRIKPAAFSKLWDHATIATEKPVLAVTAPSAPESRLLLGNPKHGGEYYVSPALSPDGRRVMFFSSRGLFAIDLYMADAKTGKILQRITSTATSPHFNNLEFINSAGAWSPDGRDFVFGQVRAGQAELAFYALAKHRITQAIPVPGVGEVFNPSWSPDGKQIVFSAISQGLTDLYLMNLATRHIRRLTDDAYAELQPAWSPDGREIAFVTDRFTTNLQDLAFGPYRLAFLNPGTGAIRPLATPAGADLINPQWSPHGRFLYFVANYEGIPNLYRMDMTRGGLTAMTNLQTGVAGITALSPAISVAQQSGEIVYSAFANSGYDLWRLPAPAENQPGLPTRTQLAHLHAGWLPPPASAQGEVARYMRNPGYGLPPSTAQYASRPYHPHLHLTGVIPANIGFGVSNYGPMFGGGTALQFQDLLGTEYLTLQIATITSNGTSNFLRNFSGVASYFNDAHRWQWGVEGGQVPYITGAFSARVGTISGQPVQQNQFITFWEMNRQALGTLDYPFSRAQRIEFAGGVENIGFAAQAETQTFSAVNGALLADTIQNIPAPKSLNFATGNTALVYDTSLFGGTSPVRGQRYRLQIGASGGSFFFSTVLADYRHYFPLMRPLSLAVRVLHYGRYGAGANDPRLQDYFLGFPTLVRGYKLDSIRSSECGPDFYRTGNCPLFDRLLGSKLAIANGEARLELFGPLGLWPHVPAPPVELAPFYDAGIAWSGPTGSALPHLARHAVTSEGITLRVNLFGYAIGAITLAFPNQRPQTGHVWEFDLLPGF